jgi:hypothetical protein
MKYEVIDYDEAHRVVAGNRFLYWDGWDIKTFRADERGYSDKRGKFKNGRWGLEFTYNLRPDGKWRVPVNYIVNSR